jgi:hypothetical protein
MNCLSGARLMAPQRDITEKSFLKTEAIKLVSNGERSNVDIRYLSYADKDIDHYFNIKKSNRKLTNSKVIRALIQYKEA